MSETEKLLKSEAENAELRKTVLVLTEKVALLLQMLGEKGIKKNSHNSSMPPSSDFGRKTKSLRVKSERPIGGQKGHPGFTLEMSTSPDKIIELKSDFCQSCGQTLENGTYKLLSVRQVVDLPPIQPIYEEYRQYGCNCAKCGHLQKPAFPVNVNAPIQYGPNIMALVSYLNVYQYVPFKRLKHLFVAILGLPISQGSLVNILNKSREKAMLIYEQIRQNVQQSKVVGSDETSAKVNGQKWWIWVWQNVQNTFIVASNNRGSDTIDANFEHGFPKSTLISDRWAAQLKTIALFYQLCIAHILRDLIFLQESEKHPFVDKFLTLIYQALEFRKKLELEKAPATSTNETALNLEKQLNELLIITIDKEKCKLTATFQNSMIKNRNAIFPFLYSLDIPPDNNGSERAIRNIKVKQKISGQFKSGQQTFCVLRSLIDTFIKRQLDVFDTLRLVMTLAPE
jgi:transposase